MMQFVLVGVCVFALFCFSCFRFVFRLFLLVVIVISYFDIMSQMDFFEFGRDLPNDQLPSVADVFRYYNFVSNQFPKKKSQHNLIVNRVSSKIVQVWDSARLYCMEENSIKNKIKKYFITFQKNSSLLKDKKPKSSTLVQRLEEYRNSGEKLFDVSRCRTEASLKGDFCSCEWCILTAPDDRRFLYEQRSTRFSLIVVDSISNEEWKAKNVKDDSIGKRGMITKMRYSITKTNVILVFEELESSSSEESEESDDDWVEPLAHSSKQLSRNRTKLTNFSEMCVRFKGRSFTDTVAAALGTALLIDYGIVTGDPSQAISPSNKSQTAHKERNTTTNYVSDPGRV